MGQAATYDGDFFAWTIEQADALRRLDAEPGRSSNVLDLANIAEEIESLGRSNLRRVESFLELVLVHLLKLASATSARPRDHWLREIRVFRLQARRDLTRAMEGRVDLTTCWASAKAQADVALTTEGDALLRDLPQECPYTLDDLLDGDPETLLQRLAT